MTQDDEGQYRLLFEANPQPLWVYEKSTLRFLAVNDAAVACYGYSREEFLRMTIADIRPPSDVPRLVQSAALVPDELQRLEPWIHRRKDGSLIEVEIVSHPISFAGRPSRLVMANDITARRKAERALQASEERYRLLFEKNLAGVFRSTLEGRFLEVNAAFARMMGYSSREELLALPSMELYFEPEDRQIFIRKLRPEGTAVNVELRCRRKDGAAVWLLENVSLRREGSEEILEGTVIDITDRKQLEEQLRLSQKMEAVGRLAGGVAHDFNNLLTVIMGNADILMGAMSEDDGRKTDVEEILKASERAASLTRQLLAFGRGQTLIVEVLDLNSVISNTEHLLQRVIGEDVSLVSVLDPRLSSVRADPGQIEQVLMNLAINARDAMPEGGKLTIETSNVWLDEDYARDHVTVKSGPYVMMAVSDTGAGMSEETRSHAFEPFFTTKEQGKGTGLGLATVYGIVKQSGGYIWIYSEPGLGTTVKVYLPRVEDAPDPARPRPERAAPAGGRETILLVEDEDSVRHLARRCLEARGYRVFSARGGREALDIAERHGESIDLALTDVVMPEMSGLELVRRLRHVHPGLKAVFMSGYTDNAFARQGALDAGTAFLQKPFSAFGLAQRIREVLDRK
jgi:two-component system cell cycle sensor histidine kinase/response regulator CckA